MLRRQLPLTALGVGELFRGHECCSGELRYPYTLVKVPEMIQLPQKSVVEFST